MATRVLIADDNDTVRQIIRSYLEQRSDVEICGESSDGREAIDAALSLRPDVLILDVVMPTMNGIEVASIIRKKLPGTKMIVFSMYGDSVKALATAAGVDLVITKPEGMSLLIQAMHSILN
jgi:two-component system, NarL family, response regulator LiaR